MNDIYIPKRVPRIKVTEKLHGHTTIDLHNVRTGKYERVEHDNMFTDALEDVVNDHGQYQLSPIGEYASSDGYYSSRGAGVLKSLLGGVMLFDSEIPTNRKTLPAGVKMTANGAKDVANSTSCPELGSYNAAESSQSKNSATFVYDFSTSQGNGNIASVALTSWLGGYIGYGNASNTRVGTQPIAYFNANGNRRGKYLGAFNTNKNRKGVLLHKENKIYMLSGGYGWGYPSGTTSLTLYEIDFPSTEVDVFANYAFTLYLTNDNWSYTQATPITIEALAGYTYSAITYKDFYYLYPCSNTLAAGATFKIYKIDTRDCSVTTFTITNTSGEVLTNLGHPWENSISSSSISSKYYHPYMIDEAHMAFRGNSTGTLYSCNLSTSVFVSLGITIAKSPIIPINEDGTLLLSEATTTSYTQELNIVDTVNGTTYPVNGRLNASNDRNGAVPTMFTNGVFANQIFCTYHNGNNEEVYSFPNPLYLATINNLDSPVTKTADKTMKVTYTITRAS